MARQRLEDVVRSGAFGDVSSGSVVSTTATDQPSVRSSSFSSQIKGQQRRWPLMLLAAGCLACAIEPARADLRMCNQTGSKIGVTLGYRDLQGWVTEGWWDLKPKDCETLLKGALAARFYYVFAIDFSRGGEWSGRAMMCTKDTAFTIRGVEDCLARGYDRNGFIEVDTGEQKSWTIQLSDPSRPISGQP